MGRQPQFAIKDRTMSRVCELTAKGRQIGNNV
ncbi:MAG: hypothetical protein RL490_865, partial [Pseudomonadota bacterium]